MLVDTSTIGVLIGELPPNPLQKMVDLYKIYPTYVDYYEKGAFSTPVLEFHVVLERPARSDTFFIMVVRGWKNIRYYEDRETRDPYPFRSEQRRTHTGESWYEEILSLMENGAVVNQTRWWKDRFSAVKVRDIIQSKRRPRSRGLP